MANRDYSEWSALAQKAKAIHQLEGFGSTADLARHLEVIPQRSSEWINGHKEPRAEITLKIQAWVKLKEYEIAKAKRWDEYQKLLKRMKKA